MFCVDYAAVPRFYGNHSCVVRLVGENPVPAVVVSAECKCSNRLVVAYTRLRACVLLGYLPVGRFSGCHFVDKREA